MTHTLTLQQIDPVTHNVNRLVFDRPDGFDFDPGQATLLRLDRDGWRDEKRPFTFTSLPDAERLEFTIKSYPDHDGVTEQIGRMTPGDTVLIGDAWGAIADQGPGTFIAGGAGITPFIAILRARHAQQDRLTGSRLIFSNACARDIILRDEWEAMSGLDTCWVLTEEVVDGMAHGQVDGDFLDREIDDFSGVFYVCGPRAMEDDIVDALTLRGAAPERIVTEDHPD